MFVGGIVVRNQMNGFVLGSLPIDEFQEFDPLLVTMLWHAGPDHRSVQRIQGRKQGSRPVALVVMSHCAAAALLQRQSGLRPIKSLDLTLLIDREHQGVLWRVQVQTDDVLQLLDELRILAELEGPDQVRLQAMAFPDPADGARTQPHHLGQTATAPVGSLCRLLLRGLAHHLLDHLFGNRLLPPRPRGIFLDASDPILDKAATPKTDRPACRSEELSDLAVLLALGAQQDDPRSLYHTHGSTPSSRERSEFLALLLRENDWRRYSHVPSSQDDNFEKDNRSCAF